MTIQSVGHWLGWFSSLVLIVTIGQQLTKQWKEHSSQGVSKWFFIGQMSAEAGFIVYSFIVKDWIFVCTNSALFIESIVGVAIVLRHRKHRQLAIAQERVALFKSA